MNRLYCLALAVSTFVLTSYLVDPSVRGLSPAEMNALRGGNGQTGKWTTSCASHVGVYLGCTKVGGPCTQCANADEEGDPVTTDADYLNNASLPDHPGGMEEKSTFQDCGNIWRGTCATDPTSPTGFKCEASDTGSLCSIGVFVIGPQN